MKFSYDPRYNIAYIRIKERKENVTTIHISESLNIDLTPDGTLYGIELLNANEQLFEHNSNQFIIENEATGKISNVSLV
ncbi:MAG: DUF2283 domain-containing protein [Candidatus Cloacimonadota bacterium]|nr:DUF2283 domain-containing protein [Candidatus Cloacimonadota bacterium]